LVETGVEASQVARSFNNGRYYGDSKKNNGGREQRPKSAGAPHQSACNNNYNNSNTIADSPARSVTPELPPIPSISRSNVLRDLKSLTRRKSGGGQQHHASAARLLNSDSLGSRRLQQQRNFLLQQNVSPILEKEGSNLF
jgi:hypothetical protein